MDFERYAARINNLRYNLDSDNKHEKVVQKRLQVKNTEMKMTSSSKVKFAKLNDKRYYFSDGIVSLPFGHPSLNDLREYKKSIIVIHKVLDDEKDKILNDENMVVNSNERLRILRSIFSQPIKYYTLKTHRHFISTKKLNYMTTRQYILNSHWL